MGIFMRGGLLGVCFGLGLSGCSNKEADTRGSAADTTTAASDATVSGPGEDPTGGTGSHRVCDLYLNCLAVIAPTELPSAQQGFGPDGTCWQGSQASADQCLMACTKGLEGLHETKPDEPACGLCQAEGDCSSDQVCKDGECEDALLAACGNGKVDGHEICDGDPGCDADCQGPAVCSPITQAGCTGDDACLVLPFENNVACMSDGDLPGPDFGDPCVEVCAAGSVCNAANQCEGFNCCIPLCDLHQPATCPEGTACTDFGVSLVKAQGLDYVGACRLL